MMIGARTAAWAKLGGGVPTAKDYVQKGLLRHVDGIENLGYGNHDENPSSWHDLVFGDEWNTLNTTFDGQSFELLSGTTGLPIYCATTVDFNNNLKTNGVTLEIAGETNRSLTKGNLFGISWFSPSYSIYRTSDWLASCYNGYWNVHPLTNETGKFGLSLVLDSNEARLFFNGTQISTFQGGGCDKIYTDLASWNSTIAIFGNGRIQYEYSSKMLGIKCFGFRLYVGTLTAAEIAANYAIDKARFNLPDAA